MDRRRFIGSAAGAMVAAFLSRSTALSDVAGPFALQDWEPGDPRSKEGPAPEPEITALVDVMVPADPDIPNDFSGSDYDADWVVAASLGSAGQLVAVMMLNRYAKQVHGRRFLYCNPEQQMDAIKQWIIEREELAPLLSEMLSGLLTLSMIGTYEDNDEVDELELFESMGWYDPNDPTGTFRIPCEGYPDARAFPVMLKKGLQK
jgi:hypothetical protein